LLPRRFDAGRRAPGRGGQIPGVADIPVFLLSLKAGGTGLNLTAPTRLFISTRGGIPPRKRRPPIVRTASARAGWSPSYKLIAAGTVEEKVSACRRKSARSSRGYSRRGDAVSAKLTLET